MSQTLNIQKTYSAGGKSFNEQTNVVAENLFSKDITIPAPKNSTLTTRTDNDTGTFALTTGHGLVTGNKVDIYWTVSGVQGHRRNMTATVTGDNAVLDGGLGDNLPPQATAGIVVCLADEVSISIDPDDMMAYVIYVGARGIVQFLDGSNAELKAYIFPGPDPMSDVWYKASGLVNPLGGNPIGKIRISHADTTAAREGRVAILFN